MTDNDRDDYYDMFSTINYTLDKSNTLLSENLENVTDMSFQTASFNSDLNYTGTTLLNDDRDIVVTGIDEDSEAFDLIIFSK